MRARSPKLLGLLSISLLGACGSAPSASEEVRVRAQAASDGVATPLARPSGIGTEYPARGHTVQWGECPEGFSSECAKVAVPLDWLRPWRGSIDVFVSRYPAATQNRQSVGQLWLLAGGPGGSQEYLDTEFGRVFAAWHENYDIYIYEHRGVGESTRLGCPAAEDPASEGGVALTLGEAPTCIASLQAKWGDDLAAFNTTNAARDLKYLIDKTKEHREQQVFLQGVSAATLLLQRFLQIAPDDVDGVILDGVVAPDQWSFFDLPSNVDPVARDFSKTCDGDSVCGAKVGGRAWSFVQATLAKVDHGHCPELELKSYGLGHYGAYLMRFVESRRLFFPLFYRISRCDPQDVTAVARLLEVLDYFMAPPPDIGRFSEPIFYQIGMSEFTERNPPSVASIQSECERAALCDVDIVDMRRFYDLWPRYRLDRYAHRWADTTTPLLAMNGEWDAATPYRQASRIRRHMSGPQQNYVQFPQSAHILIDETEVQTPGQPGCALQVMKSFTDQPGRVPNTDCVRDLLPPVFVEVPEESLFFFGQEDVWENAAPGGAPLRAPAQVDVPTPLHRWHGAPRGWRHLPRGRR